MLGDASIAHFCRWFKTSRKYSLRAKLNTHLLSSKKYLAHLRKASISVTMYRLCWSSKTLFLIALLCMNTDRPQWLTASIESLSTTNIWGRGRGQARECANVPGRHPLNSGSSKSRSNSEYTDPGTVPFTSSKLGLMARLRRILRERKKQIKKGKNYWQRMKKS